MSPLVFAMVALAAVLHAAWNVLLKTSGDPLLTSGRALIASAAVFLPLAAAAWLLVGRPPIPPEAIALGIVSGLIEVAYFVLLAGAYRRGELSVVYPVARGTAPLVAIAVGVLVLGERLGTVGALGVGALVAGLLVVQRPWRVVRRGARGAAEAAIPFALACGVAIAGYSAVDRVGARLVDAWVYGALLFGVAAVGLALWIRFVDRAGRGAQPTPWPRATLAGLLAIAAYLLILGAFAVAPLSVVAPLRESAIVLVAGWGSLRLGEAAGRADAARRLGGAGLIVLGALLLALE